MKTFYFGACFFTFFTLLKAKELMKSNCLVKQKALVLLETAEDFLTKAKISFPSCSEEINSENNSECEGKKSLAYIEISKKLISDVRRNFPTCISNNTSSEVIVHIEKPTDCCEIFASGRKESGVYTIFPSESNTTGKPLLVYCDMETDGGGWTMIQRRGKFPVQQNFDQDWETYKEGFGNIKEEFWLGNENIRVLCHRGCEIRFDLQAYNGTKGYAVYKNFNLARDSYTLYISDYTGDVGDSMKHHNNFAFVTKDKGKNTNLKTYPGGWWFKNNIYSLLNGIYQPGTKGYEYNVWYSWQKTEGLSSVEIKVKPK